MAMLLRTRKSSVALTLRVFCVLSVVLTYFVLALTTRGLSRNAAETVFNGGDDAGSVRRYGRHLLALTEGNVTSSNASTPAGPGGTTPPKNKNASAGRNCTPAAILEFPSDGLTREQRQHGWALLHAALACYLFTLLAIVCDDYFVPAIKQFCDSLSMKEDIAGATFMAVASSSPELFINCVGTFITEGDIGVGTIVGSAVFNVLAVPACCGLFANMVLDLEWWSITRDSMIYGVAVILLISFLQDGKIYLYEALILVLVYIGYILMMCFNDKINRFASRCVRLCRRRKYYTEVISEKQPLLLNTNGKCPDINDAKAPSEHDTEGTCKSCEDLEESTKIWEWPEHESTKGKIWWVLTWPISFVLYITTPDCRKNPKLYVVTFLMCIFWIGTTSYLVAWLITVIGDTLDIPDSVMGLTFLAAGTSVPEAVSSVIVTNQGHGAMGLSSSIGSNTFDILLCLGLPWLIKSAFYPKVPGNHWIIINSSGITYSAVSLLSTIVMLYGSIAFNKFKLDWKVGLTCLLMYIAFICFASLVELNVFFPVNLPTCDR